MPRVRSLVLTVVVLGALEQPMRAQGPAIPVSHIGLIVARSTDTIANLNFVRPLSDGRVLINDPGRRRLVLLDSTLQHLTVLADTTNATQRAYGAPPQGGLTGLIAFLGDSSLTQDQASSAFVVIDPNGAFARIIPAPRNSSPNGGSGLPLGFDHTSHLVYHLPGPVMFPRLPNEFIGDTVLVHVDSTVIRRSALNSWHMDTIAKLAGPRTRQFVSRPSNMQGPTNMAATNPVPTVDDAALLKDGTIAIVRTSDYHIDWIAPDGRTTSGPPIQTDWVRITDSMKIAIIDSVRRQDSTQDARNVTAAIARGGIVPTPPKLRYVEPSDIPDRRSPFISGSTRVDAEGNLWVMVSRSTPAGGAVFDVIDRHGARVDRVQLPGGATLVGFGPGVIYFSVPFRPAEPGKPAQLVKARIH